MPQAGDDMSLVIALAGEKEIVVAADTLVIEGDQEAYYKRKQRFNKIFKQNNDSFFVVGLTGHLSAKHYLESEKILDLESFSKTVESYKKCIADKYELNQVEGEFIFAGFEGNEPRIYRCMCKCRDTTLELKDMGRAVSGINHGALYATHRYHHSKMNLKELQTLACFVLKEAVDLEPRLGRPLQFAVVRPAEQPHFLSKTEIIELEKRCDEISTQIQRIFSATMD